VIVVASFTLGVLGAGKLPPSPLPEAATWALRVWVCLEVVWTILLLRILLIDPGVKPEQIDEEMGSTASACRHGCVIKPVPGTKHCRRCNKCVVGFDHHCLWLNTCIGARNYKTWFAFVAVLFAWTVVGSGISWALLLRALPVQSRSLAVGHRPAALVTALGTLGLSVWTIMLLALHVYLACNGLTTLQWVQQGSRGPQLRLRKHCQPLTLCTPAWSRIVLPAQPHTRTEVRTAAAGSATEAADAAVTEIFAAERLARGGGVNGHGAAADTISAATARQVLLPMEAKSASPRLPRKQFTKPRSTSMQVHTDHDRESFELLRIPWRKRLSLHLLGQADHGQTPRFRPDEAASAPGSKAAHLSPGGCDLQDEDLEFSWWGRIQSSPAGSMQECSSLL